MQEGPGAEQAGTWVTRLASHIGVPGRAGLAGCPSSARGQGLLSVWLACLLYYSPKLTQHSAALSEVSLETHTRFSTLPEHLQVSMAPAFLGILL